METLIIISGIAAIAWIAWRTQIKKRRAAREAELHEAWHTVLEDPAYAHRRRHEERMHNEHAHARKTEQRSRKIEGL